MSVTEAPLSEIFPESTATAPRYITKDTYTGAHITTSRSLAKDIRIITMTAAELAAESTEGVLFESFGCLRGGGEGFCRRRYIADAHGNLHVYSSDGPIVLVHPAARELRVLRKFG